jgi:uncharacterized protein (TIGR02599 family)
MPMSFPRRPSAGKRRDAFTLVEVMVTLGLLLIVLVTLLEFMDNVDRIWKSTATDPFAEAQDAFEMVVNHLANAELESYQDYADRTGAFRYGSTPASFTPDHLTRRSDLDFVCGPGPGGQGWLAESGRVTAAGCVFFVAPQGYTQADAHLGLSRLLNALGYFVEFGDEDAAPAFILPATHRWRWRLKEIVQPSESLAVYAAPAAPPAPSSSAWLQPLVQAGAAAPIVAENVIALIVLPERMPQDTAPPIAPEFSYDSRDASNPLTRNQLPPRLHVVLVAIDEASAQALALKNGTQPPPLISGNLFNEAAQLPADLATLDASLSAQKIAHRIFQREIVLPAAAWTDSPSS